MLFGTDVASTHVIAIPTVPVMMVRICNVCAAGLLENPQFRNDLIDRIEAIHTQRLSALVASGVGPSEFGDLGAPGGGNAFGTDILGRDEIDALDPVAFEAFCAILWSKLGYPHVLRTKRVGDGGIDVVALRAKDGVLIQCKSSSIDGQELGWEGVKDVVAGSAAYAAKYSGVTFSLVAVTNRRFNGTARNQATLNHVQLVDGDQIAMMTAERPIRRGELATFLLSL